MQLEAPTTFEGSWERTLGTLRQIRRKAMIQAPNSAFVSQIVGLVSSYAVVEAQMQPTIRYFQSLASDARKILTADSRGTSDDSSAIMESHRLWFDEFRHNTPNRESVVVPTQVNYVGLALRVASPGQASFAYLYVLVIVFVEY